jgi:hypothetical protein
MSNGDVVLPPGVTGFFVADEPPRTLDARSVATDVFAAARRAGADCRSEPAPLMASYSVFRLRKYDVTWWLLVNDV